MGYSCYTTRHNRFGGWGVPAYCEHPDCNERIVRDLESYCGGDPLSDEFGCCLSFCERHLDSHYDDDDNPVNEGKRICERCLKGLEPFPLKPEHPEWINHLLTDESWETWRSENPKSVEAFRQLTIQPEQTKLV